MIAAPGAPRWVVGCEEAGGEEAPLGCCMNPGPRSQTARFRAGARVPTLALGSAHDRCPTGHHRRRAVGELTN